MNDTRQPAYVPGPELRTLGVFAHPDDETLSGGPLLATMARRGHVTLVTTNRGERGEVIGADLAHLAGDHEALGDHRSAELTGAITALGIDEHYFADQLPGLRGSRPERYTDSGMQWPQGHTGVRAIPAEDIDDGAFSQADIAVSARLLAALIRTRRPHLVLTEEPDGGYGHPDHIAAHRVTMRAVELAAAEVLEPIVADDPLPGLEPWRVPVVAWVVRPAGRVRAALDWLAGYPRRAEVSEHTGGPLRVLSGEQMLPTIVRPDEQVDLDVPLSEEVLWALDAAMGSHRTQIQTAHVDPGLLADSGGHAAGWFGLSNDMLQPVLARGTAMVAPGWGSAEQLAALVGGAGEGPDGGAERAPDVSDGAGERAEPDGVGTGSGQRPDDVGAEGAGAHAAVQGDREADANAAVRAHAGADARANAGADADSDSGRDPRWYSALMMAMAGLMAVLVGSIGTVFHRWERPFGLLLALLVVLTGSVLARTLADRRGQVAYVGVVFVVVLAMTYLGNGDVIVANEPIGVLWLLGAPVAGLLGFLAPGRWFGDGR